MEVINEKQKKFAINFTLYFLAFCCLIFIGIKRAHADTYTVIGDQANITVVLVSTSYGNSPFNVPKNSGYNFGQVLEIDYLINNYQFEANKHYQLESHLSSQTLTNANYYSVTGANGEQCLVSYENSVFTGSYPRWDFQCSTATTSITLTISNSSHEYLWSNSGIFDWQTALLKYSTTPISTGDNNTQDIINNNNQNTQVIINNQNQNTQDIIDSNKVCTDYDKSSIVTDNYYLDTGIQVSNSTYGITNYINIKGATIKVITDTMGANPSVCFYDTNKTYISCVKNSTLSLNYELPIPSNATYVRFSIHKSSNRPQFRVCQNGNQAVSDSLNNLDDTINDDDTTDAENEASEFFNSFSTETFGLTSIITAPLNLIRSVIGDGSICTTLRLPLPYLDNKYLELPCMYGIYSQYFGTFFTIYQTITYGIVAYWVIVRIFNQVKDFKNPEHDEIEVMDL